MIRFFLPFLLLLTGCATPTTGTMSLTGGAQAKKISDGVYEITTGINSLASPGIIKPVTLQRAQATAKSEGYSGFEILSYDVTYYWAYGQYLSFTTIRLLKEPVVSAPPVKYVVGTEALAPMVAKIGPSDAKAFARIITRRPAVENGFSVWIDPVFIDAVSANRDFLSGRSEIFVRPGTVRVGALARIGKGSFYGRLKVQLFEYEANLESGNTYVISGRVVNGGVEYWIEESEGGKRVGAPKVIPISL